MKYVEVRRHACRVDRSDNNSRLSQAGVDMARRVGEGIGPFDLVVASPLARAIETAVAMGFAVGDIVDELWELGPGVEVEVDWDAGFAAFVDAYRLGGTTASYCDRMAGMVRSLADRFPEGGAALAVSHGGTVEACAVGARPDTAASFGGPAGYCEGVRISYPDDGEPHVEVLRVDQ